MEAKGKEGSERHRRLAASHNLMWEATCRRWIVVFMLWDMPDPGSQALRRGRLSVKGCSYFITFCTQDRKKGLDHEVIFNAFMREAISLSEEGLVRLRCLLLMTDHVHLFFQLISDASLGRIVGRMKAKVLPSLRTEGLAWQESFHDRLLRSGEEEGQVMVYIFLNPYRADLLPARQTWPFWWISPEDQKWFRGLDVERVLEPEWIQSRKGIGDKSPPTT
jgi:putative transposase